MQSAPDGKTCESCFFWGRIVHFLDFELGRCQLFEREMRAQQWCEMWEGKMSSVTEEPPTTNDNAKPA